MGKGNRKYSSRTLRSIAFLWISFPISYLIYLAIFLSLSSSNLFKVVLSPSFWFMSFISILAGFGVLRIRWYGWYAFLLSNIIITYETMVSLAYYSEVDTQLKFLVFAVTTVFQMLLILIIAREIRVPYFFPKIRWWESDPRYKLSVQTNITKTDHTKLVSDILDLSLGGCFIRTMDTFELDDVLNLEFSIFEINVNCNGKVVWRTESTVTHPKGIGVKFEHLSRDAQIGLKKVTQQLKKLNRDFTQYSREKTWQHYMQREDTKKIIEDHDAENSIESKKKNERK